MEQIVPPRPAIFEKLIEPWQQRDGYAPDGGSLWLPKLENAPFRLCAIVNRMDLCAPELAGTANEIKEDWRRRGQEKHFSRLLSRVDNGSSNLIGGLVPTFRAGYSGGGGVMENFVTAGQGRFIFTATDSAGDPLSGGFNVIFEYRLPFVRYKTPMDWAAPGIPWLR
jgi:hypothetical protein